MASAAAFTELEEAFFRAGDNLESWDDEDPQPTWWSRMQDLPTESFVTTDDDDEDWEWQIALARARAATAH